MKKSILLTSLLALAACGGGSGSSGGGSVGGNNTPLPDISNEEGKILAIASSIQNETDRTAYLKEVLGEDRYNELITLVESEESGTEITPLQRMARTSAIQARDKHHGKGDHHNDKIKDRMSRTLDTLNRNYNELQERITNGEITVNDITLEMFIGGGLTEQDLGDILRFSGYKLRVEEFLNDLAALFDAWQDIYDNGQRICNEPGKGLPIEVTLNNTHFTAMLTTIRNKDETGEDGVADTMQINLDENGDIAGITFTQAPGSNSAEHNPARFYQELKRIGKTDRFEFNSNDGSTRGEFKMESYALRGGLGLQYSDFGVLVAQKGTAVRTDEGYRDITGWTMPFVGGYAEAYGVDKGTMIDEESSDTVEFAGIARGTVEAPNNRWAKALQLNEKGVQNAKLKFEKSTGTETLNANFDNWYNVEITNTPGVGRTFTVDDSGTRIKEDYQLAHMPYNAENFDHMENSYFHTEYYGEDKQTPEEAVALFQYQQSKDPSNPDDGNLNVFIGFGGVKKAE